MPPINTDELDDAMSVSDLSVKLGYSYKHTLKLIRDGKIECIRLGGDRGRIIVTNRALTEFLNMHRNASLKAGRKPR